MPDNMLRVGDRVRVTGFSTYAGRRGTIKEIVEDNILPYRVLLDGARGRGPKETPFGRKELRKLLNSTEDL